MTEQQRVRANTITDQIATLEILARKNANSDWLHVRTIKEVRLRFGSRFGFSGVFNDERTVDNETKDRIIKVIDQRIAELKQELENL